MGGRGHAADFLQGGDILRHAAKLEVADQHADRIASERAVFVFVDALEQGALVELRGLLQVVDDFLLGDV